MLPRVMPARHGHVAGAAITSRGGNYLYESCQSVRWFRWRLSCVLEPLLKGIHAKLLQLVLYLLLLAPVTRSPFLIRIHTVKLRYAVVTTS